MELISEEIQVSYDGLVYARCGGAWYELDGDMYIAVDSELSDELDSAYRQDIAG